MSWKTYLTWGKEERKDRWCVCYSGIFVHDEYRTKLKNVCRNSLQECAQNSVDTNKVARAEFFLFVVMQIIRVILYLVAFFFFFQICCCLGFSLGQYLVLGRYGHRHWLFYLAALDHWFYSFILWQKSNKYNIGNGFWSSQKYSSLKRANIK